MRNIKLGSPEISPEVARDIIDILDSGNLVQGKHVEKFEHEFARYIGSKHAIATSSCSSALLLILAALDLKPTDEVIVPSFTWVSAANAVLNVGAKLILADIDVDTFNVCPKSVLEQVTKNTRAVIIVHQFGRVVDIPELGSKLPNRILLIEDAACAVGSKLNGVKAGNLGFASAFSFHPRKIITTGEGGMITTNSDEFAAKVKSYRNHGLIPYHHLDDVSQEQSLDVGYAGYNFRMTEIQAALGYSQLNSVEKFLSKRKDLVRSYDAEFSKSTKSKHQKSSFGMMHGNLMLCFSPQFVMPVNDEVIKRLSNHSVECRAPTQAIHRLRHYKKFEKVRRPNFLAQTVSNARFLYLCIPLYPTMI